MNEEIQKVEKELIKLNMTFDIAISGFMNALQTFSERLERAEKWIEDLKRRMLH